MSDKNKTKEQLINELNEMRLRISTIESLYDEYNDTRSKLHKSEDMCHRLIETANDAIFITDAETGIITDVNRRGCKLLDRSLDEIRGMHQSELHPPDEEERYKDIFRRLIQEGKAISDPLYVVNKSGKKIPVEISTNVLDFGGRKIIQGIFRDITERKIAEETLITSEEKYRLLFSTVQDAIIIVDAETQRIIDANNTALLLYGYSKDEMLTLTGPNLSAEPETSTVAIKEVATGSNKQLHYHKRNHKKKDGTVFPVEISSGIFKLNDRKIISAVIRDINERNKNGTA